MKNDFLSRIFLIYKQITTLFLTHQIFCLFFKDFFYQQIKKRKNILKQIFYNFLLFTLKIILKINDSHTLSVYQKTQVRFT